MSTLSKKLLNISIDDVSPHPESSIKIIDRCELLLKQIPDLKFTFFVPTGYWRRIGSQATKEPFLLRDYPDFCEKLLKLDKDKYEIGFHGHHHAAHANTNNDEFGLANYEFAMQHFQMMFDEIKIANIESAFSKMIFRPPAWRMSKESFEAAKNFNFKCFALSPKEYAQQTYFGSDKECKNVVYYNCNPPTDDLILFDKTEIVYHACEWDRNYFSEKYAQELLEFLKKNENQYESRFIGDING